MKKEEANKTRTKLLTIINKESTLYLKTRSSMKINSKTSEEILSQFDNYEITINHCVITGIPSRSTHTKKVKRMNSLRPTMEEDIDEQYTSEMNHYIDEIDDRKVLFSKNKLKKYSSNSPCPRVTQHKKRRKRNNYGIQHQNIKKIKNAMMYLRKMAKKIKNITDQKIHPKKRSMNKTPLNSPKSNGGESSRVNKKNMIHPHKKPMSMKISEMKRLTNNSKKNTIIQNGPPSTNNSKDYEFKINLLKIENDTLSDSETNDNDTYNSNHSNKHYLLFHPQKHKKIDKNHLHLRLEKSEDSSLSDSPNINY